MTPSGGKYEDNDSFIEQSIPGYKIEDSFDRYVVNEYNEINYVMEHELRR